MKDLSRIRTFLNRAEVQFSNLLSSLLLFLARRWPIFAFIAFLIAIHFTKSPVIKTELLAVDSLIELTCSYAALVVAMASIVCVVSPKRLSVFFVDGLICVLPFLIAALLLLPFNYLSISLAIVGAIHVLLFLFVRWRMTFAVAIWALSFAFLSYFATVYLLVTAPLIAPREVGSFAMTVWALALLCLALTACARHPIAGSTLALGLLLSGYLNPLEHSIDNVTEAEHIDRRVDVRQALDQWLNSRPDVDYYRDRNVPYPVIVVASEGGGIYAASHTYNFLSNFQSECPVLKDHVFALVGVSGGSVGNAFFELSERPNVPSGSPPCRDEIQLAGPHPVDTDHMSPVIGNLLFVETFKKVFRFDLGLPDRSRILEQSFAAATNIETLDDGFWGHFWRPPWREDESILDGAGTARGNRALVPVSTNVATGNRYIFAPFSFATHAGQYSDDFSGGGQWEDDIAGQHDLMDVNFWGPTVASASFPWVTPTRTMQLKDGEIFNIADGGYFENSGVETALDIVRSIENDVGLWNPEIGFNCRTAVFDIEKLPLVDDDFNYWEKCTFPITLTVVSIRAESVSTNFGQALFSAILDTPISRQKHETNFLLDPITTLLEARSARAGLAVRRAQEYLCPDQACQEYFLTEKHAPYQRFFQSIIDPEAMGLPLSWRISASDNASISYGVGLTCDVQYDNDNLFPQEANDLWRSMIGQDRNCGEVESLRLLLEGSDPKGY